MGYTAFDAEICNRLADKAMEYVVKKLREDEAIEWDTARVEAVRVVLLPLLRNVYTDMGVWNGTFHECNQEREKLHWQYQNLCQEVQQTEEGDQLGAEEIESLREQLADAEEKLSQIVNQPATPERPPEAGF
jgi:hypothetical protein